jgi:hypothetical protein
LPSLERYEVDREGEGGLEDLRYQQELGLLKAEKHWAEAREHKDAETQKLPASEPSVFEQEGVGEVLSQI